MLLGDLLVAAELVKAEDVEAALRRQSVEGGRLGQNLVALGAIEASTLNAFLGEVPAVPTSIADTGVAQADLVNLLLKVALAGALETTSAFADALCLPLKVTSDLVDVAVADQLLTPLSEMPRGPGSIVRPAATGIRFAVSERGRLRAADALRSSRYAGPAPVSLDSYRSRVVRQKLTHEVVDWQRIRATFADLLIQDAFIDQVGPAVRSGRAMLLYGPPGNGKTSIAHRLARVLTDIVYIPYAVDIDGQVMRVFDPDLHTPIGASGVPTQRHRVAVQRDDVDRRWVACRRPFVETGGDFSLDMLDLRQGLAPNDFVAPLQVKALGGCLLIDDFGRQLAEPSPQLNRWRLALEQGVDCLRFPNGAAISLPFEAMVIFATNLEPQEIMDAAFLRHIPYKFEISAPTPEVFREIFHRVCKEKRISVVDEDIIYIINRLINFYGVPLAAFQPRFLVDQIIAICGFREIAPVFDRKFIDYALDNLTVRRAKPTPYPVERRAS